MRFLKWTPAVLLALAAGVASAQAAGAKAEDTATPEAIVRAAYESISGPAGAPRDFARLRTLFAADARLVMVEADADGSAHATSMDEAGFEAGFMQFLAGGAFFERGAAEKVTRFGHTATVLSVYESRQAAADKEPFQRGLNSFQLFFDGKRWWIQSLFWQDETAREKLPQGLLAR